MGFQIGIKRTKENAIVRKMFYDKNMLQVKPEHGEDIPILAGGEEAGCITWYLTTLKGRDQKKIQNEMVDLDTAKGSAKMRTGTATETRIVASVVAVDGIEWGNGTAIEVMTQKVFADLEQWQINQLGEWVDEINQDSDSDKEAERGES